MTDGWLGQLIALAIAKGDFTAEHAETKTEGEREGRPAVDLGAGSEDLMTPPSTRPEVGPARTKPRPPGMASMWLRPA